MFLNGVKRDSHFVKRIKQNVLGYVAIYTSRFTNYAVLPAATGFGLGLSPYAPGTTGALLAIPLMFCLQRVWGWGIIMQIFCCIVLTAGAVYICEAAERKFQHKDDRRIVADEYLTFPIGMIGLPVSVPVFILAFVTNRLCDVLKPPPAYYVQKLRGGLGVTADDVISALYSLAINHIVLSFLN
jgi:phosphatidylglycerophosphatase A